MYIVGNGLCITSCVILRLCRYFGFDTASYMRPEMFPQMILSIESFAAFLANMLLLTRMNDNMQSQLFLAFEALHAYLK